MMDARSLAMRVERTVARRPAARWLLARRAGALDILVALVTTGIEFGLLTDGSPRVTVTAVLLTVLSGAILALRRRAPLLVVAGTVVLAAVLAAIGAYPGGAPVMVAVFTIAERREWRLSVAALVPTMVAMQLGSVASPPVTIGAWALGAYAQTRRRYMAGLEERAADLERERDQLSQIAAQAERASIARELHDIVAHSVTVMLLGVRGARDVLRTSPGVAEDTLRGVETSAQESIAELRRVLAVLRGSDQIADIRPQPGLAQLGELIDGYRTAGLRVELRIDGDQRTLPDGVELSVYRIVEEALTNVLKHARPHSVMVALRFHPSMLEVQIDDDGAASVVAPADTGHGIVGMRERVTALGGVLEAQAQAGGGFRVGARVPIEDAA